MSKAIDIAGQRFGFLVALSEAGRDPKRGGALWLCQCDCGRTHIVKSHALRKGHTRSCGCQHIALIVAKTRTHGHASNGRCSPELSTWRGMVRRCTNPRDAAFPSYGGRGITVCERWHSFEAFIADMGPRPPGRSLDRIDNNAGYEPGNCRWATATEQQNNKRDNRPLEHDGRTMTLSQWAAETGLKMATIWARLRKGWKVSDALSTAPLFAAGERGRRLDRSDVEQIRAQLANGVTHKRIAQQFGCSRSTVNHIATRRLWRAA